MKKNYRRWISSFLVAVLVLTSLSTDAYAATGKTAAQAAAVETLPGTVALPDSVMKELEGTEAVYFGLSEAAVEEGEAYYTFLVHREGDLQTEASVSLLSLDVSALYGRDYEFSDADVYESGDGITILEKSNGNNEIISNDTARELLSDFEEAESGNTEAEAAGEEESAGTDGTSEGSGMGSLTESILSSFVDVNADQQSDEEVSEMLRAESFDFSAGTVLHFSAGEAYKQVRLHVMEDELEEGDEMFQLVLADAEGTVIRGQYTFSLVITDNEELHDAKLSFTEASYSSENGTVTVTVKREGSLYSMIDFRLKSVQDTALAEKNYEEFSELITMQPYQTEAGYSFAVAGEGRMEVCLQAETGCVVEGTDTAEVLIGEEQTELVSGPEEEGTVENPEESSETADGAELLGEENQITKKIGDRTYTVMYELNSAGQPCNGTIWDDSEPKVKVGEYIFATEQNVNGYRTGDEPNRKKYHNGFVNDTDVANKHWFLRWYSALAWEKGASVIQTKNIIPSVYYSTVMPEWEASKKENDGHVTQQFEVDIEEASGKVGKKLVQYYDGNNKDEGKFDRKVDTGKKIVLPLKWSNNTLVLRAMTADYYKYTELCHLDVYGFALMYKAYRVKVSGYPSLDYRTAGGGTLSSIPLRLKYEAGLISTDASDAYHTIYADSAEKKSVIQFSPSNVYLNGNTGMFGEVTSFKIQYNADGNKEQQKTLNYPADFTAFLNSKKGTAGYIDYSNKAVEARIEEAQDISKITTIRLDRYMLDWLQSVGAAVIGGDAGSDKAIALAFEPIVSYTDINVRVEAPSLKTDSEAEALKEGTTDVGEFADPALAVTKDQDKPYVYHAGDTLNLTGKSNSASYRYAGYEVSYNEGVSWDFVSGDQLQLSRRYQNVRIRPVFTSVKNRIEILFTEEARKHLTVRGLIDEDMLEDTVYEGKYIYDVNSGKTDVVERAMPAVGQPYLLEILVEDTPKNTDYVYRPVIKDHNGTVYNTQLYPLIASSDRLSNRITVDVEQVAVSDLQNYTVPGVVTIDSLAYMQRDNGTKRKMVGAVAYSVIAGGQQKLASRSEKSKSATEKMVDSISVLTDEKGTFELEKICGKAGDRVPLLVSGTSSSGQVSSVVLGTQKTTEKGEIAIRYPYDAPEVISVMYSYENDDHNLDHDTNQNSINIYDDDLNLQFTVDAKGKEIASVVATILSADGTTQTFNAAQQKTDTGAGTDVWALKLKKMTRNLLAGDRLFVQVVGAEKRTVKVNGVITEASTTYPNMDTGIVFYEKQVPAVKQYLEYSEDAEAVNIPLLGKGNSKAGVTSGVCSWNAEWWENRQGYTMTINLGAEDSSANRGKRDRQWKVFHERLANAEEKEPAENLMQEMNNIKEAPDNIEKANQVNEKIAKDQGKNQEAKPQVKGTDKTWSASIAIMVALNFAKVGNEYKLVMWGLVIGGTYSLDYSKFVMFGPVPGYLIWGGEAQVDLRLLSQTQQAADMVSLGTFKGKQGNVSELLGTKSGLKKNSSDLTVGFKGYFGAGVGANNLVGAKGILNLQLQVRFPFVDLDHFADIGWLIGVGGGIKIDLLVTSLFINIANKTWGLGAWEGKADKNSFSWFGVLVDKGKFAASSLLGTENLRETELLGTDGNEQEMLMENLPGSGNMENFGSAWQTESLLGAVSEGAYADPVILKEDVADNAGIRTVQISDDGDQFLVFLDSREGQNSGSTENGNAQALYYSIYDASERKWAVPQLLDPDGTFDAEPDLNVQEDVVTVSWASAEQEFKNGQSKLEQLAGIRVKTAAFRITDNTAQLISEPAFVSGKLASPSVAEKKSLLSEDGTAEETEEEETPEETTGETAEFLLSGLDDLENYYDTGAQSWMENGRIYTVFTRYDLSGVNDVQEVTDYGKVKPAVYLAEYDAAERELLSLRNLSLTCGDMLLVNSDVQLVEVSGIDWRGKTSEKKHFMVISYTEDSDGNLETAEDNDLKLCLVEIRSDRITPLVYPSMDISDENGDSEYSGEEYWESDEEELGASGESDAAAGKSLYGAKITQVGDSYYLSYLKDGYLFELIDIGAYMDAMFEADYSAEYYREKAEAVNGGLYGCTESSLYGGSEDEEWFCTDMEGLNDAWEDWSGEEEDLWIEEGTGEETDGHIETWTDLKTGEDVTESMFFEASLLQQISLGELNTYETILGGDEDHKHGADDYQIVTDGENLYILYLDYPENRLAPEKELYCVRFSCKSDTDTEEITNNGYSTPVQITDAGHVIDNFAASMTADGTIRVISEYYDQELQEEGELGIVFSTNSIAMLEFRPGSRLEIPEAGISYQYDYDGESTGNKDFLAVYYDVENTGLEPQEGYQTWVLHDGEKIFYENISETQVLTITGAGEDGELLGVSDDSIYLLSPGEWDEFTFFWELPEKGKDEKLTFVTADRNGTILSSTDFEITTVAELEVLSSDVEKTADGFEAAVTVENTGSLPSESTELKLNLLDENYDTAKVFNKVTVPALQPGEDVTLKMDFNPLYLDYNDSGVMFLETELTDAPDAGTLFAYAAGEPEMAMIGDGESSITLRPGEKKVLNSKVYPLPDMTGSVRYTSSDPAVAEVAEDGTVTAKKYGTAVITAYFADWDLSDSLNLIVSGSYVDEEEDSGSEQLPSYVDAGGNWKQDAKGNWIYTTRAGVKAADRWMAVARSTFGGGNGFDWFRFDKDGNMVTGWFKDSDDRMYYLQMISDGNRGRMLTGWQKIDGKWYYFSTVSNGYKGELLKNTTTPDGYKVGADGVWIEN